MFRRETDGGISGERLFKTEAQAVLVAAGDQRGAGCGADGGVCVCLEETDSLGREVVDAGSVEVGAAVAGDVGVAEIVGEDEDDVGRFCGRVRECEVGTEG